MHRRRRTVARRLRDNLSHVYAQFDHPGGWVHWFWLVFNVTQGVPHSRGWLALVGMKAALVACGTGTSVRRRLRAMCGVVRVGGCLEGLPTC